MIRRRTALGLLAGALAAPRVARAAPLTLRIGVAQIGVGGRQFFAGSPAATAHALHSIEDEFHGDPDISVQWSFFRGAGPAVNEAIANGQLDFAYQGDLPSLAAFANGLRTRILVASGANVPIYLAVHPDSDIHSLRDLRGRKVAIFRGTNNQLSIDRALSVNGLSERDFKVFNMDAATSTAALVAREIDAAFGNIELLSLVTQGAARLVYTSKGDDPTIGRRAHVLVTDDFAASHPDIITRTVAAVVRAAQYSSEEANRDKLFELWSQSGYPAAVFRLDFEGQSLKYRNSPLLDDFAIARYRDRAAQAREYKLLKRDVDLDGWFDIKALNAALHQQGLEHFWPRYDAHGRELPV